MWKVMGVRVFAPPRPAPFDGNPMAAASLGISPRELEVLQALAAGLANKEIVRHFEVPRIR
jgi:DNA-binding NarL/FixJ family response regulator